MFHRDKPELTGREGKAQSSTMENALRLDQSDGLPNGRRSGYLSVRKGTRETTEVNNGIQ